MRILISLLFFLLLNVAAYAAEVSSLAKVSIIKNAVQVKTQTSDWHLAKENETLSVGDQIRVGRGSAAEITFISTGSKVKLGELSQITLDNEVTDIHLSFGKIFVSVVKGKGGMKIKSPVAVAGVLGTVGALDFYPDQGGANQYSLTSIDGSFEITDTKGNTSTLKPGHTANLTPDGINISVADTLKLIKDNAEMLTGPFIKNGLSPENIKINPATGQEMLQLDTANPNEKIEMDSTTGDAALRTDPNANKTTPDTTESKAINPTPPPVATPVIAPVPVILPVVMPVATTITIPDNLNVSINNTTGIKGNLNTTITNMPTPANPLPVTGVLNANIITTTHPIPVSGHIAVSTMPTTDKAFPVTGNVKISNLPTASTPLPVHGDAKIVNHNPIAISGNINVSNMNDDLPDFFKPGPYYKTILMANGLLLKDVLIIEQKGPMIRLRGHLTTTDALVPMEGAKRNATVGENLNYDNKMMLYPNHDTKNKSYYEKWVDINQIVYIYNQVPHPNQEKTNTDPDLQ